MDTLIRLRSDKVEELRKRQFLTQEGLAKACGISPRTYVRLITNGRGKKPLDANVKTLSSLCNVLRCKVSSILDHELDDPEDAPSPS